MYSIIEHIEYLMLNNDCVVLPGWGALIAQYSEAMHDHRQGCLVRPQRRVSFNASVNHNDGLLAHSIMRREGVTYDEAVRTITQSVQGLRRQLYREGEVSMGRLGYFQLRNDAVEFMPFLGGVPCDDYFGLRSISVMPLAHEEQEGRQVAAVQWTEGPQVSFVRRYWQVAASIVMLLGLTALLTTPIVVDKQPSYASMSLTHVSKPHSQPVVDWSGVKADFVVGLPQGKLGSTQSQAVASSSEKTSNPSNLLLDEGGKYSLVISTLSNLKQVSQYMAAHPDMAAHMQVEHASSKIYRIVVARSHDKSRLWRLREQLPPGYEDAWINF